MGLERTIYSVFEDVGVVEVCVIMYSPAIDCPIAFPFDVSLSTNDNTAGIGCLMFITSHHAAFWIFLMLSDSNLFVYIRNGRCLYLHIYRASHRLYWTLKDIEFSVM